MPLQINNYKWLSLIVWHARLYAEKTNREGMKSHGNSQKDQKQQISLFWWTAIFGEMALFQDEAIFLR